MTFEWRHAVAVVLLLFAWKGSSISLEWPLPSTTVKTPQPAAELLIWAQPLRKVVSGMLPHDREYLANFYEAMAFVLLRDGDREQPIVATSDDFVRFHSGSLELAIDKASVGKYPGLAEAIDETFVNAAGTDSVALSPDQRKRLVAACGVLSWTFRVNRG